MLRLVLGIAGCWSAWAGDVAYRLTGQLEPPGSAFISLNGATTPFTASARSDERGRFDFKKLLPGTYTISAYRRGFGAQRTIEIGPGTADAKHRIAITLEMRESRRGPRGPGRSRAVVSVEDLAREAAITDGAKAHYADAIKRLSKSDADGAVRSLKKAVENSPRFSIAWNQLGTIYYQRREYEQAEQYFRESLKQSPSSFEPLVNLGGVLLNLQKFDEAWTINMKAVERRSRDALANAQLGMSYYALGNLQLAVRYLETAKGFDPGHFSRPQLILAEIHTIWGERKEAAGELEDFLKHHPDWAEAAKVRATIERLRATP